ncbi:MAG: hypothetical protein U0169_22010 [Polyangiaceae bacterium]
MKLWPSLFVLSAAGLSLVACGDDGDSSTFDSGAGGDGGDTPRGDGGPDATTGSDGSTSTNDSGPSFTEPDATLGDSGGSASCVPRTCAQAQANCGPIGDGCGGLLQCGTCTAPESCGGGGVASRCSEAVRCMPKTCADFPVTACGPLADGCGGLITCGVDGQGGCVAPQSCGGAGVASQCGGNAGCTPRTVADCATANVQCGPMADGCGGFVDCGGCPANESCGAGGPSKCGTSGVDAGTCTKKTCADYPANSCGPVPDGCGGVLTCGANGGTCTPPQSCGGGGTPSVCGGSSACVPKTCNQLNATCGAAGDGCGGTIPNCGDCAAPQTCGGGGTPSQCGGMNACVKKTCADYPADVCGAQADGCGGTITCGGGCTPPQICGGGGVPSKCGGGSDAGVVDAGPCTNLCPRQVTCDGGGTTTLTGTVRAPTPSTFLASGQKADPIYNAVVYVPNGTVQAFPAGVSCSQCGAEASGLPLVKAFTGPDGKFTLTNVPTGANIPLVIQVGRWRRKITIANVPACTTTALTDEQTRLPRWQGEGDPADNIPLLGIVTGHVDALECVLRKIGIDQREFTGKTGGGRVRMFQGLPYLDQDRFGNVTERFGERPPSNTGGTRAGTELYGDAAELAKYDAVLFPCEGRPVDRSDADKQRIVDYVNSGGRLFDTHYHYTWLYDKDPFSRTATWNVDQDNPTSNNAALTTNVDTTFPKGQAFAEWLGIVGALSNSSPAQIQVNVPRHDIDPPMPPASNPQSQRWGYSSAPQPETIQHYTFNTPVGADPTTQCGRVVFSDFHVSNASSDNVRFPGECNNTPMNAQERVIEFMLFDLTSCIQPDRVPDPPSCTKRTCGQQNANCGTVSDGCGGTLDCGTCTAPQTCGGAGTPNQCGGTGCVKRSCSEAGATCGQVADGCGGLIDCGPCNAPQTCGGGGTPNQCGNPSCTPKTCAELGVNCGPAGDGCGGLILTCGDCTGSEACGGGGSPGVCGNAACTALTCMQQGADCGPVANGCGGITQCGPCPPGQVCGGGGPSKCGASSCMARTCAQAGAECGPIGDGCGGTLDCGPCRLPGQTCGAGGPSKCGGCVRASCQSLGYECGPAGDGCGGSLDCGSCIAPETCGGGGTPFKCGKPDVR